MRTVHIKEYFEDFDLGDTATSPGRTIIEADQFRHAGLIGQYGKLETNKAYMEEHHEYGEIVPSGPFRVNLIVGMWKRLPDWDFKEIALYEIQSVKFPNPAFFDETVHLEAEVVDKHERDEDSGFVVFRSRLVTEEGKVVAVMDWNILLERDPDR